MSRIWVRAPNWPISASRSAWSSPISLDSGIESTSSPSSSPSAPFFGSGVASVSPSFPCASGTASSASSFPVSSDSVSSDGCGWAASNPIRPSTPDASRSAARSLPPAPSPPWSRSRSPRRPGRPCTRQPSRERDGQPVPGHVLDAFDGEVRRGHRRHAHHVGIRGTVGVVRGPAAARPRRNPVPERHGPPRARTARHGGLREDGPHPARRHLDRFADAVPHLAVLRWVLAWKYHFHPFEECSNAHVMRPCG